MKSKFYIPFLLFFSFILINSCSKEKGCTNKLATNYNDKAEEDDGTCILADDSVVSGEAAPNFSLSETSGNVINRSDYNGKVLVLFFFGNSCPSCKAVGPSIQSTFVNAYAGQDVAVVGIDQWDGNAASVNAFKSNTGVSFPLLMKGSSTANEYSTTYDRIIVIDKNGFIRFRGTQVASNDLNAAKSVVDSYLN